MAGLLLLAPVARPLVRPEDLKELGLVGVLVCAEQCFAGLRVPVMGGAKAPDVAQKVHQHALRQSSLLEDEVWMRLGHGRCTPAGRVSTSKIT